MRNLTKLTLATAALAACPQVSANAATIYYASNIATGPTAPYLLTFNGRSGVGRTFSSVPGNGDRIFAGAIVHPSPDSDVFATACGADQCITTNGHATDVDVLAGPFEFQAPFVGLTSGLGGTRNLFMWASPERPTITPEQIDYFDNNPFQFRITNPLAPTGPTQILRTGPDYNPDAMPGYVNNITISGGGLSPTLNWEIADDPLAAEVTNQQIFIRRVQGSISDGTFESYLLHTETLAADATSYTFDTPFNVFETEPGLVEGATYEVGVYRDIFADGSILNAAGSDYYISGSPNLSALQGRSRTFFEFTPLASDTGDGFVYLPSVDPEGVYHFDFDVTAETPYVIDPIIAIGYDYQIGAGDTVLFNSVVLPTIASDDGFFDIFLWDGDSFEIFIDEAAAGTEYVLGGVDRFRVLGIDQAALLDPADVTAFLTTLTFAGNGQFTGTMTPLTVDTDAVDPGPTGVPEPMTLSLLGTGLFGLGWARRKQA